MVNLPSPTDFFTGIGSWSSPLFDQLLPFAYLIIGIYVGAMIVGGIIRYVSNFRLPGKSNYQRSSEWMAIEYRDNV